MNHFQQISCKLWFYCLDVCLINFDAAQCHNKTNVMLWSPQLQKIDCGDLVQMCLIAFWCRWVGGIYLNGIQSIESWIEEWNATNWSKPIKYRLASVLKQQQSLCMWTPIYKRIAISLRYWLKAAIVPSWNNQQLAVLISGCGVGPR